jgi:hypothetical protein
MTGQTSEMERELMKDAQHLLKGHAPSENKESAVSPVQRGRKVRSSHMDRAS